MTRRSPAAVLFVKRSLTSAKLIAPGAVAEAAFGEGPSTRSPAPGDTK